jgi:hypothetical protein
VLHLQLLQFGLLYSAESYVACIYQCWNCYMNKNCFACMTPSNPKFDKRLWNKSFTQHMIENLNFTVLVPEKSVATTPRYSIRFDNRALSKDQPSLKLELLESESMPSFNTGSHL